MEESSLKKMHPIDELRNLPDCLLHHILSFLKTKESVRTSVLSKRWINVWKSVPRLDLNAEDFDQVENFETFVNSILHHKLFPNPEKIDTFNLRWHTCNENNYETIDRWIYNLVSLKPRVVNISLSKLHKVDFFSYLFNCPSLETMAFIRLPVLSLGSFNPEIINLPFLKSLHLTFLILGDEFNQKLISGCPILEKLVLYRCYFNGTDQIRSNTLKKLVLWCAGFGENIKLRISTPNLVELICAAPLGHVSFENLESLEFATVHLTGMKDDYYDAEDEVKILKGISNARSIELLGFCVNHMVNASADLPVFKKLEMLKLISFQIYTDLDPINFFLNRAPNLKDLTLEFFSMKEQPVPEANSYVFHRCGGLRTLEIVCSRCDEEMHELLKSLLVLIRFKVI